MDRKTVACLVIAVAAGAAIPLLATALLSPVGKGVVGDDYRWMPQLVGTRLGLPATDSFGRPIAGGGGGTSVYCFSWPVAAVP